MLARILHITSANSGFTLMETLIAMLTGFVVTGALFTILQISTTQSSRIADVAQATQLGRTTMTHIVDETHSACLSSGFTPVQAESTANKLIFVDGYSEKAEVPSVGTSTTGVRKDEILWSESAHTLTDFTYLSTGTTVKEEKEEYTFSATPTPSTGVRIGEHITKSGTTPIFKYYAYATTPSTSPTAPSSTLEEKEPLEGTLSKEAAESVASVLITFKTAPRDGKTELGRDPVMSTQATFAFEAPNSETPIVAAPCE